MLHDKEVNRSNGQNVPAKDERTQEVEADHYGLSPAWQLFAERQRNGRSLKLWKAL